MIVSKPYGGIGNRLKCIISSMVLDEDLKLIWEYGLHYGKDLGGVWCKFSDLFENKFEEFSSPDLCPGFNCRRVEGCTFFENINHLDMVI